MGPHDDPSSSSGGSTSRSNSLKQRPGHLFQASTAGLDPTIRTDAKTSAGDSQRGSLNPMALPSPPRIAPSASPSSGAKPKLSPLLVDEPASMGASPSPTSISSPRATSHLASTAHHHHPHFPKPGLGLREAVIRASSIPSPHHIGSSGGPASPASPSSSSSHHHHYGGIVPERSDSQVLRSRSSTPAGTPAGSPTRAHMELPDYTRERDVPPMRHNSDGALLAGMLGGGMEGEEDAEMEEDDDDDEGYKGHPKAGPSSRRSSSLWAAVSAVREVMVSPSVMGSATGDDAETTGRSSFAYSEHDPSGRKTPARYRPATAAGHHGDGSGGGRAKVRASKLRLSLDGFGRPHWGPQSAQPGGGMRRDAYGYAQTPTPGHASYAEPWGSISGGSVQKPAARRGAMNLRKARQREAARRRGSVLLQRNSVSAPRACFNAVFHICKVLLWSLIRPRAAIRNAMISVRSGIYAADEAFRDPRTGQRVYKPDWLDAYIPIFIWLAISLSSTFLVIIFHQQVFNALDHLASSLRSWGLGGKVALGALIFMTTFPPLPLYSTLIILCGFTFGLWEGFLISYISALLGAIAVFTLSRTMLRSKMEKLLDRSGGLKKVIRAIEKQPRLLFLIRLAPYPYNLMNTLLASSSSLTLRTYTICTALALPKLLVHCGLGTSIKDFATYKTGGADAEGDQDEGAKTAQRAKQIFGFGGVILCIGIFLYLLSVARRAVDELDDDDATYEQLDLLSDDEDGEHEEPGRSSTIPSGGVRSDAWPPRISDSTHSRGSEAASPWQFSASPTMREVAVPPHHLGERERKVQTASGQALPDSEAREWEATGGDAPLLLHIENMEASAEEYDVRKHLR